MYPTLNIFDPITLKTWRNLRRVLMEYGTGFIRRSNMNISLIIVGYSFVLCIIVLQIMGILSVYSDPMLLILLTFDSLFYFKLFIMMMMGTAFINSQFKSNRFLLAKNKDIIADFNRLSYVYFGKDALKPDNIVYKEGLRTFKEEFGDTDFEEKVKERTEVLITMIEDAIDMLEFEEVSNPSTLLGIAFDYGIVKSMLIGVASVAFAAIQSLTNK